MLHKKWIAIAVLASAALSSTAFADNRGINTALGAVVGAVIGNSMGGQNAAVVGGVLGAVVGASVSGHENAPYYGRQRQTYYQPQTYYQAPTYYRAAPVYARPYSRGGYAERNDRNVRRVDYRRYGRGDYRR
jgi:uncharacterized protein YcfJ